MKFRMCAMVILTLALTTPVIAGNISTGKSEIPVPTSSATTNGEISSGIAEIAWSLIESVLALF